MAEVRRCIRRAKSTGAQCQQPAMRGQDVCRYHGGKSPQAMAAAERRLALAEATAELDRLGRAVEVDPAEAMLAMVWEAAGNVAFLRGKVQELRQDVVEVPDGDEDGVRWAPGGIAGPTGSVQKPNEAAPHVLVAMYDAERERLVRWAKACRDAGVEEHRVRLAEQQGQQLAQVLRGTLDAVRAVLVQSVTSGALTVELLDRLWSDELPVIVRGQILEVTGGEPT